MTIWQVRLGDENYEGERKSYLVSGKNAGEAEAKAIRLAKRADAELVKGEAKHAPYVREIELIGDLDG